jgi:mannosyl-3-phosphoglycerate phosphatase
MDSLALPLMVVSDVDASLLDYETYSARAPARALQGLQEQKIPLVLCSSKTSRELQTLQERLQLAHPFICENGAALYVPAGYFPFDIPGSVRRNGHDVRIFGSPHHGVLSALRRAARATKIDVASFSDMTTPELARETGLTPTEAAAAKQREHDEPFRLRTPDATARRRLEQVLAQFGVTVVRGRRYDHAMAGADKGTAIRALRRLYRRVYKPLTVVGLGDGLNDVPLLRSVDVPIVVRSRSDNDTLEVARQVPWAEVTERVGPAGWQAAVLRILDERSRARRGAGKAPPA